mmetsp:Transcript_80785/g.250832  ORF Transcript_80785/g.250832 Transcript_80785/m.250832 type:complete len:307 (-) Transcript_80785:203-1123(-)
MPRRAAARKVARPAVSTLRAAVACDQELEQALEASRRSARARQLEDKGLARALELSEEVHRVERELARALELSKQEALDAQEVALAVGPPAAGVEAPRPGRLAEALQHEAMAHILRQRAGAEGGSASTSAKAACPLCGGLGPGGAGPAAAQPWAEADGGLAEAVRASLASAAEASRLQGLEEEALARAKARSLAVARREWGRWGAAARAAASAAGPAEFDLAAGERAAPAAAADSQAAATGAGECEELHDGLGDWWLDEEPHAEWPPEHAEVAACGSCGEAAAAVEGREDAEDEWLMVEEPAAERL